MILFSSGGSSGDPFVDWIVNNASAVGILAFVVVGFLRGWIVPGSVCESYRHERDRALEQVFALAEIAKSAIQVADKLKEKK